MKKLVLTLIAGILFSLELNAQFNNSYPYKDAYGHSYKNFDNLWKDTDNDGIDNYYDRHDKNPNVGLFENTMPDLNNSYYNNYKSSSLDYNTGRTIYEGPRGGHYYINSHGNKTYVRRRKW